MNRLVQEMRIISPVAWAIAALGYVALVIIVSFATGHHPEMQTWPPLGLVAFRGLMPLVLIPYIALIGYVNADARRRGMRYVVWTLLAIFIPNALGIILYFVLREPMMTPCPHCATLVKHGFAFCPACGTAVGEACPQCKKAVEPGWSHCPVCGAKLGPPAVGEPSAQPHS
jgi:RNA polymerase subunit RPABC4/transcription elongation factor Spt4